jgi:hypothetical protein
VKIFTALSRFVHRSPSPTPVAPAPFDDGLVQLAQLIAVDDPATSPDAADTSPRMESAPPSSFETPPQRCSDPDVEAAKRTAPKSRS